MADSEREVITRRRTRRRRRWIGKEIAKVDDWKGMWGMSISR